MYNICYRVRHTIMLADMRISVLLACILAGVCASASVLTSLNDTTWNEVLGAHPCLLVFTCDVQIGFPCYRMDVEAARVASILDNCTVARTESTKQRQHAKRYESSACLYEAGLQRLCCTSTLSKDVVHELRTYWTNSKV